MIILNIVVTIYLVIGSWVASEFNSFAHYQAKETKVAVGNAAINLVCVAIFLMWPLVAIHMIGVLLKKKRSNDA